MKKNKQMGKDFFYKAADLMCIADIEGNFRQINRAFETSLGYSEEELISRSFLDFIHPEDRESVQLKLQNIEKRGAAFNFLTRFRANNGNYRWLSWNAKFDQPNNLIYATARDISDQKETEEELRMAKERLEQANNDLEAFSYSVSHDLRTPLRAIEGFSQILLEDYIDHLSGEGRRFLRVIIENTRKMGDLIEDILTFSRISRADLVKTTVNMERLFTEAFSEVMEGYPELNGNLKAEIQDLPPAKGDMALLKQVAVNLVSNAVKYSSRKNTGHIKVGYLEEAPVTYYIKDNGVGFNMKYADKLFHVFQRLHSSSEYEGTGVGLSLVKRIIDHHGGEIWADSELGEGSTFYIQLPD